MERWWPWGWDICHDCGNIMSNPCSALFGANSIFPLSHAVNPHHQRMCWPLGWDPFPIRFHPSVSSWAGRFFPASILLKLMCFPQKIWILRDQHFLYPKKSVVGKFLAGISAKHWWGQLTACTLPTFMSFYFKTVTELFFWAGNCKKAKAAFK